THFNVGLGRIVNVALDRLLTDPAVIEDLDQAMVEAFAQAVALDLLRDEMADDAGRLPREDLGLTLGLQGRRLGDHVEPEACEKVSLRPLLKGRQKITQIRLLWLKLQASLEAC